jgi:hypothetical protein
MFLRSRPRGSWLALVGACSVLSLVQACGGRSDTEEYLYGADGPITVGATSSGGSSAVAGSPTSGGAAGIGASSAIGGAPPLGGTTGAAGQPFAGQPSVGGTGVAGGGQGGVGQGGVGTAGTAPVAGAAGAPDGPPITCGADVCNGATQSCCAGFGGLQCVEQGETCQGAVLGCTNNSECGAERLCCLSFTGDASAASSCLPQCNTMPGSRDRQLCQVDGDCRRPFRYCTPTVFGVNICTRTGFGAP